MSATVPNPGCLTAAAPRLYKIVFELALLRSGLEHSSSSAECAATELAEEAESLVAWIAKASS